MKVTIHYELSPGEVAPTLINGAPPADQSALVVSLTQQNTSLQQQLGVKTARVTVLEDFARAAVADAELRKAADAAKNEGQNLIDTKPPGL